jgi:hypothetical protein
VHSRWPPLAIKDAFPTLDEIRQVKSTDEMAALRKAAAISAQAFCATATAIAPGRTQRQIEGEVLRACVQAGSNGPSLWLGSALFAAFFDSTNVICSPEWEGAAEGPFGGLALNLARLIRRQLPSRLVESVNNEHSQFSPNPKVSAYGAASEPANQSHDTNHLAQPKVVPVYYRWHPLYG